MTFIVENGTGVYGANAGVPVAYVTDYLTNRGRETENLWSTKTIPEQQAAIVAATQYVNNNFETSFAGLKEFTFAGKAPTMTVTMTVAVVGVETLTLQTDEFTLSTDVDLTIAASDLADLITANSHYTATSTGPVVTVTLSALGEAGNYTSVLSSTANVTATAFTGGCDDGDGLVSFPRVNSFFDGMPRPYLWALCEYSVRAMKGLLVTDPKIDPSGMPVSSSRKTVGPITKSTSFVSAAYASLRRSYPAADNLMKVLFVNGGAGNGGTMR